MAEKDGKQEEYFGDLIELNIINFNFNLTLVTTTQEFYTDSKIKRQLLYPMQDLILSVVEIEKIFLNEIHVLNDWIARSRSVLIEFKDMDYKSLTFKPEASQNLHILFDEMNNLPIFSELHREIFKQIYIYNWFSKADEILQKDWLNQKENRDDLKITYEQWLNINNEIEPFKEDEAVTETKIYKTFKLQFNKAKKLYNLYEYGKGKLHSKIEIEELDKILRDAKSCKINLQKEIEVVCKKLVAFNQHLEKFAKMLKSKEDIKNYDIILAELNSYPFKCDSEISQIKSIKANYLSLSSSLQSLSSSSKPPISSLESFISKYKLWSFTFPEAESILQLYTTNQATIAKIRSLHTSLLSSSSPSWESLQPIFKAFSSLFFSFEPLESSILSSINSLKLSCFLQTFKSSMESKPFEFKIDCGELSKLMQDYKSNGTTEDLQIIVKVEEYLKTIKEKIESIEDIGKLEKFEREGSTVNLFNFRFCNCKLRKLKISSFI